MAAKHIIVIGGGPGGLAAGMLLQSKGFQISVFEKQPYVGGRTSRIEKDGYVFDRGPTFLNMPHILEEAFQESRRDLHDYVTLKKIEPMYELVFNDLSFFPTTDKQEMYDRIKKHFPGDEDGYYAFMEGTKKRFDKLMPILQNTHGQWRDYLRLRTLKAVPQLALGKSLYDVLSDYFTDERLKLTFTFQSKYLGMSPWNCPGAFSILSYMEYEYGVFHPLGGMNQLSEAMAEAIREDGGAVRTGTGVKRVLVEDGRAVGVELDSGEQVAADEVIINADFAHAASTLFEKGELKKWNQKKLDSMEYSCSAFMIYLGLDTIYDTQHHTIVFADDYKQNVEEITGTKLLSKDPSIYVQNGSVTDDSLAPEGQSALYILVPVPNNLSKIDWEKEKQRFRDLALDILEKRTAFKGVRDHIVTEMITTPKDWEEDYFVYNGATFNLAHSLDQMMYFRPHNKFEDIENCWLVGGGTHPGSGLPTIIQSARITAGEIKSRQRQGRTAE